MTVSCLKTIRIAALALLLLGLSPFSLSHAQPSGSYEATCTQIDWLGDTLSARCADHSGLSKATELPFADSCPGDISNVDGNLTCVGPTGSFAMTCRNIAVRGGKVYAECKDGAGNWHETSHPVPGYMKTLENCQGQLKRRCN